MYCTCTYVSRALKIHVCRKSINMLFCIIMHSDSIRCFTYFVFSIIITYQYSDVQYFLYFALVFACGWMVLACNIHASKCVLSFRWIFHSHRTSILFVFIFVLGLFEISAVAAVEVVTIELKPPPTLFRLCIVAIQFQHRENSPTRISFAADLYFSIVLARFLVMHLCCLYIGNNFVLSLFRIHTTYNVHTVVPEERGQPRLCVHLGTTLIE